ncbi:MAG TPA: NrfD/PsrC family molybdoenzyme membrane anchor subunit [Solirubrobacteraceae bacterium]|nr:NrfD/PsrC family molybdoenzyme membrane anchor subunit [Solirubrobacteraceae bacterium]
MSPSQAGDPELGILPLVKWDGKPPGSTTWDGSVTEAGTKMRSYYGRPVIKEPVWEPEIATYFFTGGLGGASAVLSLVARMSGNELLARRALFIEAGAEAISPLLLTADLGRPERFLNMLRVFKVTSPMSVGSWVMTFSALSSSGAAALELLELAEPVKLALESLAGLLGPAMATYTAVLIANTAVPVWHDARHSLPPLFAASSAASAGAAAAMVVPPHAAGPARRLAIAGTAVALGLGQKMEKRLGMVGEPYKSGLPGRLNMAAKVLTAAGAATLAVRGRRSRGAAAAGGALILAGEMSLRWAIFKAGDASARDPKYTVLPQRERADQKGTHASQR